jgi:hypothetical protein
MNQRRFVKIAIITTALASAGLAAGATGTAIAADMATRGYHGYVGAGWGWDGWGWDSGPYAGYLGTDWEHHIGRPVGWGYYPLYVPLAESRYYGNPLHGY